MRCVIAGSRDLGTYKDVDNKRVQMSLEECPYVEEAFTLCDWHDRITEIVSGKAMGIDNLGEQLADKLGLDKNIMPADWDKFGNRAGPLRNEDMSKIGDIAIVIMIKGGSHGSRHMVNCMKRRKKPVMAYEVIGGILCPVK
jgi:hypothetical protein